MWYHHESDSKRDDHLAPSAKAKAANLEHLLYVLLAWLENVQDMTGLVVCGRMKCTNAVLVG